MKPPVTLRIVRGPWPHLALGLWLGVSAAYPCLAEDDLAVPILDKSLRTLDFGFKRGKWATPYHFETCMRPCTNFSRPDSIQTQTGRNSPPTYKHDFSFSLKESGPLSFRVSGNRLKMKVEF